MKKTISVLGISTAISGGITYWHFLYYFRNCVGCGIAPDGVTDLGPGASTWITEFLLLECVTLLFFYAGAFIGSGLRRLRK